MNTNPSILIYAFAAFGAYALLLILIHHLKDPVYDFKTKYLKKYKPKYAVGQIIIVPCGNPARDVLCRITHAFVEKEKKAIKKNYFVEPLHYGLPSDLNLHEWVYGYDYFDKLHVAEELIKEVN